MKKIITVFAVMVVLASSLIAESELIVYEENKLAVSIETFDSKAILDKEAKLWFVSNAQRTLVNDNVTLYVWSDKGFDRSFEEFSPIRKSLKNNQLIQVIKYKVDGSFFITLSDSKGSYVTIRAEKKNS